VSEDERQMELTKGIINVKNGSCMKEHLSNGSFRTKFCKFFWLFSKHFILKKYTLLQNFIEISRYYLSINYITTCKIIPMIKRNIALFFLFSIFFTSVSKAQPWRSQLYPSNWNAEQLGNFYSDKLIQDFSYAGYHRGEKEVPTITKNIVDVTKSPYNADNTGKQDVTTIIQAAINAAGKTGGVVFLPAGTYKVSPGSNKYCLVINRSNVVLRGAGIGKTFIYNSSDSMRQKAIIKVETGKSWNNEGENKQLITKDLMKPTKQIPVTSIKGFKVGDLVIVRNFINNDWIEEHKMTAFWKDQGNVLGGLLYCRKITAINATTNELTIDIPIRYALKTAHGSGVYKVQNMLSEVGIEDFSIGNRQSFKAGDWTEESYNTDSNGSYQSHDSWAIAMEHVVNSWINRVASYHPEENTSGAHILSNGIRVSQTKNVSILNCEFHRPQYGGGGGNGYMYRIVGNETLIKHCIAEFNRHGFVLSQMSASGNVFYRCRDENCGRQTGLTGYEKTNGSGSDHHMHFSHSNLFDQCTVENSYFAAGGRKWGGGTIHGLTGAHSLYWNLTSNGTQDYAVETQQGRYGYVIGTSGNKPTVRTSAWAEGSEKITNPVDYTEGISKGNTLSPRSLYTDQKSRRILQKK
jgi:hypothetical protein